MFLLPNIFGATCEKKDSRRLAHSVKEYPTEKICKVIAGIQNYYMKKCSS